MKIDVLTLFPDMVKGAFSESILKKAIDKNVIDINLVNIRDFSKYKHKRVDDSPYGGGSGMLMMIEPLKYAIESVASDKSHTIYLSPRGSRLNQEKVIELSEKKHLVLVCGHYEGIDERFIDKYVDEEISIGDFILTGGELAATLLIDATSRYVGGVLGKDESLCEESFENNLLEYPQYTRPSVYDGVSVPDVLLSGNHNNIEFWRYVKSLEKTFEVRPDLFYNHLLKTLKNGDKASVKKLSDAIKNSEFIELD
ncbi:MAG: tRNA (guanosine(37)-N1)-methyltransferase TrmD [Clostridiales bacterium]|nr:MAG: tRNA (guanosine(37)-N1)-methyltransferase TrmD [Clostridiales bacterium]